MQYEEGSAVLTLITVRLNAGERSRKRKVFGFGFGRRRENLVQGRETAFRLTLEENHRANRSKRGALAAPLLRSGPASPHQNINLLSRGYLGGWVVVPPELFLPFFPPL